MVALTALCKMLRWPKTCTCFVQNVNRNCLRPFYNRLVSLQVLELRMCIYSAACMMWVSYLQKNCMLIFKKKRIACKIIPLTWVFILSPYLFSSCLLCLATVPASHDGTLPATPFTFTAHLKVPRPSASKNVCVGLLARKKKGMEEGRARESLGKWYHALA